MVGIGFDALLQNIVCCQFNPNALSLILENVHEIALATNRPHSLPLIRNHLLCMIYRFSPSICLPTNEASPSSTNIAVLPQIEALLLRLRRALPHITRTFPAI